MNSKNLLGLYQGLQEPQAGINLFAMQTVKGPAATAERGSSLRPNALFQLTNSYNCVGVIELRFKL